ncbi:MAG TPA: hypothetical protein VHH90_08475 [Polyangia bacterium]|nr:hypothetical protein [Polyangia bacterium]
MPEDFFLLHRSTDVDRDGSKLQGVLAAHLSFERARGVREVIVYGLLALSLPVWIAAARPRWMSADLNRLVLAAWLVAAVGLVLALVSERRWHRRCIEVTEQRPALRGPPS